MARFSDRVNTGRSFPPKILKEIAPEALRSLLINILERNFGALESYQHVTDYLGNIPDSDIFSNDWARGPFHELIRNLEWFQVYDLLEMYGSGRAEDINTKFKELGLAYVAFDGYYGDIQIEEEESAAENESQALQTLMGDASKILKGRFEPASEQFERANSALYGRPADYKSAVSNAANALESVVKIITQGSGSFSSNIDRILAGNAEIPPALGSALKSLFGFASDFPGIRHGSNISRELQEADAKFAVRVCSSAIVYLIQLNP